MEWQTIENIINKFTFKQHMLISFAIRTILIIYGEIQDDMLDVPYTDLDYKIITHAARYVLKDESPFNADTYRYSPIIAYLMLPNLLVHKCCGKVLFCIFDLIVAIVIRKIVLNELSITFIQTSEAFLRKQKKLSSEKLKTLNLPKKYQNWANYAAYFWLYNPLTAVISSRGNGDSFSSFFVLITIYLIQRPGEKDIQFLLAGIIHGFSIHLRIYPLIYSLAYYLNLSERKFTKFTDYVHAIVRPNTKQFMLITGTVLTLFFINVFFYDMYGYKYIYEAFIYHIVRKDFKHNFSVFFLMQYLGMFKETGIIVQLLKVLPRALLLFYFSVTYGVNRKTLSFGIFVLTTIFVIFNSVITSQYFVWFLTVLPLCLKNLRSITPKLAFIYFAVWMIAQGMWLLPAYLLEFQGWNTYNCIGLMCGVFFLVNIYILGNLIKKFEIVKELQ